MAPPIEVSVPGEYRIVAIAPDDTQYDLVTVQAAPGDGQVTYILVRVGIQNASAPDPAPDADADTDGGDQ